MAPEPEEIVLSAITVATVSITRSLWAAIVLAAVEATAVASPIC